MIIKNNSEQGLGWDVGGIGVKISIPAGEESESLPSYFLPDMLDNPEEILISEDVEVIGEGENEQEWIDQWLPAKVTPTVSDPKISIESDGTVTITCKTEDAIIYYTIDGSDPTNESTEYTSEFTVEDGVTVKAIAYKDDLTSNIVSKTYNAGQSLAAPEITISKDGLVTITCDTEGAIIYYTIDGSTPTESSPVYSDSFTVSDGVTVNAMSFKDGIYSDVVYETYTSPVIEVATPEIVIDNEGVVTITCATADSIIYYTDDGTDPTDASTEFTELTLTEDTTIKAIAYVGEYHSSISTMTWYKPVPGQVNAPQFSPNAGDIDFGDDVTITCTTPDSTIHYTTDGSDPTTSSEVYSTPIKVESDVTIKAIAVADGMTDSVVVTAAYTVVYPTVATPVINPPSSSVLSGSKATITCSTVGATIHYTTDGSNPTDASPVYEDEITITEAMTIKAIGILENYNNSAIASATYTIEVQKVATPVFNPNGGNVNKGDTVTMTCNTAGADIYYTTDGSIPDSTSSKFTSPVVLNESVTINAIGIKEGWENSEIKTATFTVALPVADAPSITPNGGEVLIGSTVEITSSIQGAVIHYTDNGSNPTSSSPAYSTPIEISSGVTIKAIVVAEGYQDSSVTTAVFTISKVATPTFNPTAGEVASGSTVEINCSTTGAEIHYTIDGSTPTSSSPVYSDPIAITSEVTIKAIAIKNNYADSSVGSAHYTVAAAALNYYLGLYNATEDDDYIPEPITKGFLENLSGVTIAQATGKEITNASVSGDDGSGYTRYVYAYPAKYGTLSYYQLTGASEYPIDTTFEHEEVTIDGAQYYVYWNADSSLTNNVSISFR